MTQRKSERKSIGTGLMNRLCRAHVESGLTQVKVAAEAGLDVSTVWRHEDGRAKPSKVALRVLSLILYNPAPGPGKTTLAAIQEFGNHLSGRRSGRA